MLSDDVTKLINREGIEATHDQYQDMDLIYQHLKKIAHGQRLKVQDAGLNTNGFCE